MTSRTAIYAKALLAACEKASVNKRERVVDNFFEILRSDRLLPLASNIIKSAEQLIVDKAKAESITAEFARKTTAHECVLIKSFQVTQTQESPKLIGGFKIEGKNRIIDASVKDGLARLREVLSLE